MEFSLTMKVLSEGETFVSRKIARAVAGIVHSKTKVPSFKELKC